MTDRSCAFKKSIQASNGNYYPAALTRAHTHAWDAVGFFHVITASRESLLACHHVDTRRARILHRDIFIVTQISAQRCTENQVRDTQITPQIVLSEGI